MRIQVGYNLMVVARTVANTSHGFLVFCEVGYIWSMFECGRYHSGRTSEEKWSDSGRDNLLAMCGIVD